MRAAAVRKPRPPDHGTGGARRLSAACTAGDGCGTDAAARLGLA